jgi:STE24 endopeptidase
MPFASLSPSLVLSLTFAGVLVTGLLCKFWLMSRQIRHVIRHRAAVPTPFVGHMTLAAHQKAADYTVAKARMGLVETVYGAALLIAWTLLGGLDALNQALTQTLGTGMRQELALLLGFTLISGVLDLPLSLYRTFVLETRFGFNKMNLKLWVADVLKSSLMGLVIGLPLASGVLWLMSHMPPHPWWGSWWFWAWVGWTGFNVLLMLIYPRFIAPLFNTFKPLDDPALSARVNTLMQRCGFKAQGFYVMDGSTRSAHANAYFTGFGTSKRVVFFDTLLTHLNPAEVDAVLAHELGHFSHKHVLKRMLGLFSASLLGFVCLGWLSQQAWFFSGLGVQALVVTATGADASSQHALALLLFMLSAPVLLDFIAPLMSQISRRQEFEADAYAQAQTSGSALASALLKLYTDNASTLTPDPLYARVYYSHPPASERLQRLNLQTAGTA